MQKQAVGFWKKLLYTINPEAKPIPTRLTEEEVIGIARRDIPQCSRHQIDSIGARPVRQKEGVVWSVRTNLEWRDNSMVLTVDDATGQVRECRFIGLRRPDSSEKQEWETL